VAEDSYLKNEDVLLPHETVAYEILVDRNLKIL
jgi:hypothetical protein